MHKFPAKLAPRVPENGATSILMLYSNSRISKTRVNEVSCNSNEFDELSQKMPLSKGIFPDLDVSKMFGNKPLSYVKLDEKNDGDVAEPLRSTVLQLCINFLQNLLSRSPRNGDTTILIKDLNSWSSKSPVTEISFKSNEFDKLTEKILFIVRAISQI